MSAPMPAPSHRDSRIRRIRGNKTTVADPLQVFEDLQRLTGENRDLLQRLRATDLENEELKEEVKSADQENANLKEELKSADQERDWMQYKLDGAEHEIRRLFLECREVRKELNRVRWQQKSI